MPKLVTSVHVEVVQRSISLGVLVRVFLKDNRCTGESNDNFGMGCLVKLLRQNVRNVVPRMTVQALLETLLIHVMTNKTDTSAKHEQRVDRSDVNVFLSFLTINIKRN